MKLSDLDFEYPEELVATERAPTSRVMLVRNGDPREVSLDDLISEFNSGEVLVLNDTRVIRRRVFAESGLEILFLDSNADQTEWSVLCPSTRWKDGVLQKLPDGVSLELVQRGRPQTVRASKPLTDEFFESHGDLPLPPYIQKARGERRNRSEDGAQYQTAWADKAGSLAAPTASLHFSNTQLEQLRSRGVEIVKVTLHVGLGTFLPISVDNLDEHQMHAEIAEISEATWKAVQAATSAGKRVWALGTTVTRTLESAAAGKLKPGYGSVAFAGDTDLFIRPGFEFKIVTGLLTNFHQPRTTLVALVSAFSSLETVKQAYAWAIERKYRLFSYGDLTAWIK